MNTIECFTVATIILLGLFPYKNNAARLPIECTTSSVDINYQTEMIDKLLYLKICSDNTFVSPLNDIPLNTGQEGVFRAVIVIPKLKWSKSKLIDMKKDMNPIYRLYSAGKFNLKWDYGALTQTWEDPCEIDPITNQMGDNGQLDVIVLGERTYDYGAVVNVKIVGAYPMVVLETGMTNWQIIAIDAKDRRADSVNNINDFNTTFPGMLNQVEDWVARFNIIKPWDPINKVLQVVDAESAAKVVKAKHNQWKKWQETHRYAPYVNPYNTTLNNKWTIAPWMNLEFNR